MEKSTLIKTTLAVSVAVILIAGCLMPVLDVKSDSDTLDVLVIDGQSNAEYDCAWDAVDLDMVNSRMGTPSNTLYYYGNSNNPTAPGDTDKDYAVREIYSEGFYRIGGHVAPLAYYISEKQHRDILVISVGVRAQSIANLVPGTEWGIWKNSIIQSALSDLPYAHINMLGWCWLQGEADGTIPVNTYIDYFNKLDKYYDGLGIDNCYIVKLRDSVGGNAAIAQNQIIKSNPSVYLGTDITETFTGTENMADELHYSQAGRIVIGEKVAETIPAESFGEWDNYELLLSTIPTALIIALILAIVRIFLKSRAEK